MGRGVPLLTTFVDTSAFFALLDRNDQFHEAAKRSLAKYAAEGEDLVTHSYVLVETLALAQRRLGANAARELIQELAPVVTTMWVDEPTHEAGVAALLAALPTDVSFVDFVSFQVMREQGISVVFGYDDDFIAAGFAGAT